jgi:hypothetical protein
MAVARSRHGLLAAPGKPRVHAYCTMRAAGCLIPALISVRGLKAWTDFRASRFSPGPSLRVSDCPRSLNRGADTTISLYLNDECISEVCSVYMRVAWSRLGEIGDG